MRESGCGTGTRISSARLAEPRRRKWVRRPSRRVLQRLLASALGLLFVGLEYAIAQQSDFAALSFDSRAGTSSATAADFATPAISPEGAAAAAEWSVGPQNAGAVSAAMAVTSAGRTAGQFSVTPTGGASYNIPVWTPPGARDIEPHLALRYTSGGPDGALGPGWGLSGISTITRCNKTWAANGAPAGVTLSTGDELCMDGNRLRLTSGMQGGDGSVYQTEIADFSKVVASGQAGNGPAYFVVYGKDGRYYEYGNSTDSKIYAAGKSAPYMWALSKVRDRQGNNMVFAYNAGTTLSLASIQYTATPGTGAGYGYKVSFTYAARTGGTVISKYVAGGLVSQPNQLTNINVLSGTTSVRQYNLTYTASPTTNRPLLTAVQECGGSAGTDCLRPTNITYQYGAAGWSASATSSGLTGQYGLMHPDLNGDGIPDALYGKLSGSNITWYARIASLSGYGTEIATGATTTAGSNSSVIVGNFDGTGRAELLAGTSGSTLYAYKFNGSAFTSANTGIAASTARYAMDWDGDGLPDLVEYPSGVPATVTVRRNTTTAGGAIAFSSSPQVVFTSPDQSAQLILTLPTLPVDFNGDGRGDMLVRTFRLGPKGISIFYDYAVLSNGASSSSTVIDLNGAIDGASEGPGSATVAVGDWNGDGCTDLVTPKEIFIADCTGHFNAILTNIPLMTGNNVPFPYPIQLIDVDGDGQTDLVYPDPASNIWYVARSTGAGVAAGTSTGVAYSTLNGYGATDRNSDGLQDLSVVTSSSGYAESVYLHNASNTPPDLATSIVDGFGITFSPTYLPISQGVYSKSSDAVFPEIDFQGPMYVVNQFTASDGLGGTYQNQFYYWGARLNLQGRGFEGFYATRVRDNRNGLYHFTYFQRQFPFTGAITEDSLFQPDATTYISRKRNTLNYTTLAGTACSIRCFPYVQSTTWDHYEVGGTKNGVLISSDVTNYQFDSYGNITTTNLTQTDKDSAAPASPFSTKVWTTVITNTITNDATNWCLGRPSLTTTQKTAPGQAAVTRSVGHAIDYANCRATQEIVEPGDSRLQVTTTFGFDPCGNTNSIAVVGLDENGATMPARTITTSYGLRCQFPEQVTNPLNQPSVYGYNYSLGLKSSAQDANGILVSWSFDNFGRQTQESRPDGTRTNWSYADCVAASCWTVSDLRFLRNESIVDSSGATIRTSQKFYDGLDRLRFDEGRRPTGVWTYYSVTQYDNLGRKHAEFLPYSSGITGYHQYTYDLANRVTADTLCNSSSVPYRTMSLAYQGQTTTITDFRGNTTTKVTDVAGKLRQLTEPADGISGLPAGNTQYTYDSFENLVKIVDPKLIQSTFFYNKRGFKTASNDADTGAWTFTPNSLNELIVQLDANGNTTRFSYGLLGRMLTRLEPESGTPTQWTYGTSATAHNIGKLQTVNKPDGYGENYLYDSYGRPQTTTYSEDGTTYPFDYAYNSQGTLDTLTYPTSGGGYRFQLKYVYDTNGFLNSVQDNSTGKAFWTLTSANDSGLPTMEVLGNAVSVQTGYTPWTNEMISRSEGTGGSTNNLQNLSYTWDLNGNLLQRKDLRQSLTETFTLDALNRLSGVALNGTTTLTVRYDQAGSITSKSDVGTYTYGDPLHPHAVTAAGSWSIGYDKNGNMKSRAGGSITTSSYNLPTMINYNGNSASFAYNSDHQRWRQDANYGGSVETTHYIGGLLQLVSRSGGSPLEYRHLIPAGSSAAIFVRRGDGTSSTYYATSDHLGSADLVLDAVGNVLARESFTAFGARRGSNWQGVPSTADYTTFSSTTRQGFTGQEMLDSVGLVHMNGRVYDPTLGRFLSADTVIQTLGSSQAINPYAYAWNDPLKYIDPSGHSLLGDIVGIIVAIVIVIVAPYVAGAAYGVGGASFAATAAVAGFVGGFVGAYISTGSLSAALTAGLIAGITAFAFAKIGSYAAQMAQRGSEWAKPFSVLAHAAVGCANGVASGGNCGRGALAAGISDAAVQWGLIKPDAVGTWGSVKGAAEAGLVGGVAARITGGKFDDGFTVAAAGYLFNFAAHSKPKPLFSSTSGYATADDAAAAAIQMAKGYSDFGSVEYGGTIFRDINGFEFDIFRGGSSSVSFTLRAGVTDWWHTHPSDPLTPEVDRENAFLSPADVKQTRIIEQNLNYSVGAYLLTPAQVLKYIPFPTIPSHEFDYTVRQ